MLVKVVYSSRSWFIGKRTWLNRIFMDDWRARYFVVQDGSEEFKAIAGRTIRVPFSAPRYYLPLKKGEVK